MLLLFVFGFDLRCRKKIGCCDWSFFSQNIIIKTLFILKKGKKYMFCALFLFIGIFFWKYYFYFKRRFSFLNICKTIINSPTCLNTNIFYCLKRKKLAFLRFVFQLRKLLKRWGKSCEKKFNNMGTLRERSDIETRTSNL